MCLLIWRISEMIFPWCAYNSQLLVSLLCVRVCCLSGLDIDIASIRNKHEQLMLLCVLYVSLCVGVCVVFRLFEPLFLWNYYSVMFMRFYCYGNLTRVLKKLPKKMKTTTREVTRNYFFLFVHLKIFFLLGRKGLGAKTRVWLLTMFNNPWKVPLCNITGWVPDWWWDDVST